MRPHYLASALGLLSFTAAASGFDTGPQGARLLGLGGASTAYVGSIASFGTNPGLLGQFADSLTRLSVGGLGQIRRASFVGGSTDVRADQDLLVQPGGYLYATHGVGKKVAVGLALNTPFGYHTRYPNGWEGRTVVQESQLNTAFAQPTVAFKLNENFSIGASFLYAYGRLKQRRALGQYDNPSAEASFEASGSGMGMAAGLYGRTGDNLSFGLSYRSGPKLKMSGTATYTGVPARDANRYAPSSDLSTGLSLPSVLSLGLADRINRKILITFDFALSGWGQLDSLNLNVAPSGAVPARRENSGRRYEDALAFRIGGEYLATDKLTLLAGVRYDETPVRDEYITPDLVDANRLGASAGFSFQATPKIAIEGAYSFEYGQLRTARVDPNAVRVANVGGTYRLAVNSASLGVALAF